MSHHWYHSSPSDALRKQWDQPHSPHTHTHTHTHTPTHRTSLTTGWHFRCIPVKKGVVSWAFRPLVLCLLSDLGTWGIEGDFTLSSLPLCMFFWTVFGDFTDPRNVKWTKSCNWRTALCNRVGGSGHFLVFLLHSFTWVFCCKCSGKENSYWLRLKCHINRSSEKEWMILIS